MKNILAYWRPFKGWLKIPQILFEMLLHKLFNFVSRIGMRYDELSANIDLNYGMSSNNLKHEPIKVNINYIKNINLRRTLKITGIFKKWNIYKFDYKFNKRTPIYITKDKLKLNDLVHGERISDYNINKNYSGKNKRRYFKSKGVSNISELEPQFHVVVALHTKKHEKMKKERDIRYDIKKRKELEKNVKKEIKNGSFLGRSKSFTDEFNSDPILYKIVRADRLDLVQKLFDACFDIEEINELVQMKIDDEGWVTVLGGRKPIDDAKSEKMKELLSKHMFDKKSIERIKKLNKIL